MSRASVASVPARAGAWRNFAFNLAGAVSLRAARLPGGDRSAGRTIECPSTSKIAIPTISKRLVAAFLGADREVLARLAVPVAIIVFLATIATISICIIFNDQECIIAAATTELDLAASVIANDIDRATHEGPEMSAARALAQALPARVLARGQRAILTDTSGHIVASYPPIARTSVEADPIQTLSELLGATPPLTVLAEKAGVMRVALPDDAEGLATVRSLREPFGQFALFHPMETVLSDWRTGMLRTLLLLSATTAVLVALAGAYLWQATRARQADRSFRRMRDRVDMVLARGRCGLWDWDIAGGHIDWSISMYEIIGLAPTRKALSFAEVDALIHPEDGGLDALAQSLRAGAIDHVFRIRDSKGDWAWLRAKMEQVRGDDGGTHLVGIATDVSETMALEERSARADMRLRDAIETISEAFVVWDADNRLVMCNSKFQRFHDLPAEAIAIGTPYAAVMERGTPPLIQSQVVLGAAQPMGARTFEAQLGDGRWLQVNERRTKDGGYVSVGTDITALKRNEEQLIESERRLMSSVVDLRKSRQILETQAQQLAELAEKYLEQKAEAENANRAKSEFLANMGHELRTPLNAILGFSEMMMLEAYGKLGSPLYAGYCRDIHTSGQYLLSVIADVLEMSRLEAGRVVLEKEDFLVDMAIEAAVVSLAAAAETKGITVAVKSSPRIKLNADRHAVEKIIAIVLHNAVKYTPADGHVTIRTQSVQGSLSIYVEDTGVGIASDAIERLGQPFVQTDQTLKNGMRGSGLGLAIARSLIDLHGGSMRIRSQQGLGTMVMVSLPSRHAPQVRPQLAASSPVAPMPRANARAACLSLHEGLRPSKVSRIA